MYFYDEDSRNTAIRSPLKNCDFSSLVDGSFVGRTAVSSIDQCCLRMFTTTSRGVCRFRTQVCYADIRKFWIFKLYFNFQINK